jgi:L-serine dehydratase
MEAISVFDIFKIGVGPSSSHTMGPWRAAQRFISHLQSQGLLHRVVRVRTDLYGSLAKTGHGHGTDLAVVLGLTGEDPETCVVEGLTQRVAAIKASGTMRLWGEHEITFDPDADLLFHTTQALPFHPNALRFTALLDTGRSLDEVYYSVGGGFVVQEGEQPAGSRAVRLPMPIENAAELEGYCTERGWSIPRVVLENERAWRSDDEIEHGLRRLTRAMHECIWRGCHTEGTLPGGLDVVRRGSRLNHKLLGCEDCTKTLEDWTHEVRHSTKEFTKILKWVSTFALAVNEENACFGRVVTAPTNGAAGVIPAVLMHYWCFCDSSERGVMDFLLTAGEIGSLFKKGATISAAMGGCQAEIGVSSAMAAAGLTQAMGGSVGQVLQAAEIAMEHHLGMTCDPIKGLVQIPCIERNTMGAMKAITAANIALESNPKDARVSLDDVIATMWATAKDMQSKYKETSEGGLATHVSVSISEC